MNGSTGTPMVQINSQFLEMNDIWRLNEDPHFFVKISSIDDKVRSFRCNEGGFIQDHAEIALRPKDFLNSYTFYRKD
jgi:hypothetical protein